MKPLERLQILIGKLTQKEKSQFKRYCEYKLKRKALKLFNIIVKHKDEALLERFEIDIKRNKLQTNLRFSVNELFELILRFLDDNTGGPIRDVNKMIHHAQILTNKGLREEGLKLFEKVIKVTEETEHMEQTLLANRMLYLEKSSFIQNKPLQLSDDFLEYQSKTTKQITVFNECISLYYSGMYLHIKGLEVLEKEERNQLLDIRKRGQEIIENKELPLNIYIRIGSLLAGLCSKLTPSNFQLAEHYHLNILKRIEELDDHSKTSDYFGMFYGYMIFLVYNRRVEDYKVCYNKLLNTESKAKADDINISGILILLEIIHPILDYNEEKADKAINKGREYLKVHYHEVRPSLIQSILFLSFQLAIIKTDLDLAELFLEQLDEVRLFNKHKKQFKLTLRISSLLMHYERNNYQWILNQNDSIKRLYSRQLKNNIGARLLLKLLVQLSITTSKKKKSTLVANFLQELTSLFKQYPAYRYTFNFIIIEEWAAAKLNLH